MRQEKAKGTLVGDEVALDLSFRDTETAPFTVVLPPLYGYTYTQRKL
ncbi:MAG TPA: hypothetical protein VNA17_07850 [Pyrinomonadaceae bacterium]|nr:hypothetical protein [Pyrinomonadaceae bacterium]